VRASNPFHRVPDEIIMMILVRLGKGVDIVRCKAVCRRWRGLVDDPRSQRQWERNARRAAARAGLEGPWLDAAAADRGWIWVWCALAPLPPPRGYRGRPRLGRKRIDNAVCCGEFMARKPLLHGYGFRVFADGRWGCGHRRNNLLHGRGVVVRRSGERREGDFFEGKLDGRGTVSLPGGSRHEGRFRAGKPHGRGVRTVPGSYRRTGRWNRGKLDGWAVTAYEDGDRHECHWSHGQRHGASLYAHAGPYRWWRWGVYRRGALHGRALYTDEPRIADACSKVERGRFGESANAFVRAVIHAAQVALVRGLVEDGVGRAVFCREEWADGAPHGGRADYYGDGAVTYYRRVNGRLVADSDARFLCVHHRSGEALDIDPSRWILRRTGIGLYALHPHPTNAPEAFAVYRECLAHDLGNTHDPLLKTAMAHLATMRASSCGPTDGGRPASRDGAATTTTTTKRGISFVGIWRRLLRYVP
jgi:hypothetical protein